MTNLVAIEPEAEADDVIAKLEEVLALARDGKVSSVAIAIVYRDGAIGTSWSTIPSFGALLGAVSRLAYKINGIGEQL